MSDAGTACRAPTARKREWRAKLTAVCRAPRIEWFGAQWAQHAVPLHWGLLAILGAVLPAGLPNRRSIRLRDYDYAAAGPYFVTLCACRGRCVFGRFVNGRIAMDPIGQIIQSCWEQIPSHFPNVTLDAYVVMPNHMHGIIMIHERGGPAEGAGTATAARGDEVVGGGHGMPCPYDEETVGEVGTATDACRDKVAQAGTACRAPTPPAEPHVPFAPIVHEGDTQEKFSSPVVHSLPTVIRSFKSAVSKRVHEQPGFFDTRVWQRGYYEHIIRSMRSLEQIRCYIADNPSRWPDDPEHPVFVQHRMP